jgi:hypothetical protein
MARLKNATRNTRIYRPFEYHLEDLDCSACLHCKRKSKFRKNGCGREVCAFEDIRAAAFANGRLKRERGWNRP